MTVDPQEQHVGQGALKYPWVRDELLVQVRDLSDLAHQQRVWLNPQPPYYECFEDSIHFFFDDHDFGSPENEVGWSIYASDVALIQPLVTLLGKVSKETPATDSSESALRHPLWPSVVDQAKVTLLELSSSPGSKVSP